MVCHLVPCTKAFMRFWAVHEAQHACTYECAKNFQCKRHRMQVPLETHPCVEGMAALVALGACVRGQEGGPRPGRYAAHVPGQKGVPQSLPYAAHVPGQEGGPKPLQHATGSPYPVKAQQQLPQAFRTRGPGMDLWRKAQAGAQGSTRGRTRFHRLRMAKPVGLLHCRAAAASVAALGLHDGFTQRASC
jgi:hypothetical protein